MHIENFKVFCDLVENQSFSKAAKINNLTQSAVSQQLRTMEKQFKILIIDRSQKQFKLTPQGEKVYSAYTSILKSFNELEGELLDMQKILCGDVHVATVYSIGLHELPSYIRDFLSKYPEVNLKVEYRRSNLVYEDVEQGSVDMGLVAYKAPKSGLSFIPFKEDDLVFVCSPKHPLAKKQEVEPKDLDGVKFIAYEKDIPTRQASDKFFDDNNVSVKVIKEYDNTETVKNAVEINSGIALLPAASVKHELKQRTLKKLYFDDLNLTRPLFIVHKKSKVLGPVVEKLIEILTENKKGK